VATRYQQLVDERAQLRSEGEAAFAAAETEGRDLTAAEQTRDDAIQARLDAIAAQLALEERRRQRERNAPAAITDVHDRAADKPFANLGEQLHAIYQATVNRDASARGQLMAAALGSSEAVDSDGGYLLQDDFAAGIERRMHDTGALLSRLSAIPVSGSGLVERQIDETSRADGSRSGAVRGYWLDEAASITSSRPKFRKLKTELEKVAALGYATDELLDDFSAMASIFEEEFAEELVFKTEDAIYEGDGAGKPLGFTNTANPCLISVAKETGQAAATIVTSNISKMWVRLPIRSRATSVWLYNQDVEPTLDELTLPAGTAALEPRFVSYDQQGILRIKGRPAVAVEYASTLGTVGDFVLADLTQYRLIGKGGVQQARSMHVAFTTDEMAFRAVYRVGGQPKWKSAVTPFKGSATISPFIVLATRA
jgi:HK97 family phage major capsid protein